MLPEVTYQEVLEKDLKVMDTAAISLCRDNGIPIGIFDLMTPATSGGWSAASGWARRRGCRRQPR